MDFPDDAAVRRHRSDPPHNRSRLVDGDATDPFSGERLERLASSGFEILPVSSAPFEGVVQQRRCRINQVSTVNRHVNDPQVHVSRSLLVQPLFPLISEGSASTYGG